MTDINQWRRMIQPSSRAKTPAIESEDGSMLSGSMLSPTTPRKGLRPKLSSYLSQHTLLPGPSKTDLSLDEDVFNQTTWYPLWSNDDPAPSPDAEKLMDTVMCKLLADPYRALDPRFNSMLMHIFESYRRLKDDKENLHLELVQECEKREALQQALHHASEQWEIEKQDYKAEVKRLELILAKGKRGLAEVTLARQDSIIRHRKQQSMGDDTMETIFEFLEKTKRFEDRQWSSQRATMRRRSPSAQMRRLSKTLTANGAHVDMPLGKPSLSSVSFLEEQDNRRRPEPKQRSKPTSWPEPVQRAESQAKTHCSDDTLSTFSCSGDLLPDEAADLNLIQAAGTDNDFVAIKRIAHVLAKRRHIDPDEVMPKLQELFGSDSIYEERSSSLPTGLGIQLPEQDHLQLEHPVPVATLRKHPTLKGKASGFLSKLRPQLTVDTSVGLGRRFSFEAGDDAEASLSAPVLDTLPPSVRERLIRKSASMSSLDTTPPKAPMQGPSLSPVAQSPTTSAPLQEFAEASPDIDETRPTRIPTPVYQSGSLARPRRDREDSASSLLTAIKVSRPVSQRSGSGSSTSYSSPSASRTDLTQGVNGSEIVQGSGQRSNRLLHHTNSLHGSVAVAAAQKAAGIINLNNFDHEHAATHGLRKGSSSNNNRSSTQSGTDSDMGEPRKENQEPMRRSMSSSVQGNATR